jgi:hypothetical protein
MAAQGARSARPPRSGREWALFAPQARCMAVGRSLLLQSRFDQSGLTFRSRPPSASGERFGLAEKQCQSDVCRIGLAGPNGTKVDWRRSERARCNLPKIGIEIFFR